MDGKCLQVDLRDGRSVNVGSCTGQSHQQWKVDGALIRSLHHPGECVDSGVPEPPPETTGRCLTVQVVGLPAGSEVGPALELSDGDACDPSAPAAYPVRFEGEQMYAGDLCLRALRGRPSPFGPLQLWGKPQPTGMAVLLLNRGSDSPSLSAQVQLIELGFEPSRSYHVRDLWARRDLPPVFQEMTMTAASGDSQLLLLTPLSVGQEMQV
ncbi:Slc12a5 [Symbiodinium natans]|uniref:Slc12a5 protein n=1 Tax=Symbiodinium natans TaxID=878477 RepID=A0A812V915_9DINO|nr:Slc12a5 [Symbiodinium natans]